MTDSSWPWRSWYGSGHPGYWAGNSGQRSSSPFIAARRAGAGSKRNIGGRAPHCKMFCFRGHYLGLHGAEWKTGINCHACRLCRSLQGATLSARYKALNRPLVYVFRNTDGVVIYVGRARGRDRKSPIQRFTQHKLYSSWWSEVASSRYRFCESWGDSLVLEALLIRRYQPKYNLDGVSQ